MKSSGSSLFDFEGAEEAASKRNTLRSVKGSFAPLAQLVEQLTLNQRAPGSSP